MMKRKKIAMKSVCLETSDDNMDKEVDDNFMWGEGKDTKYDILVTLSMNKFTNIVIPTYFQFIQRPII